MRFLSVCSGVDAASMAWTRAYGSPLDWTCAGYAEIEPFPRAVLEQRHGAVAVDWDHRWQEGQNYAPLFGDFTQIGAEHVGPVDLLVGGTPCQSFSVAGKRLGLDDPRGNLAIEFLALARRIGARWMVWENVPGVYSSWSGEPDDEAIEEWSETADFAEFLNLFRECGYRGGWRTLDAQYVRVDGFERAVPQRRRRVFVVGHLGNDARAIPVLFDPDSLRGIAAPRRGQGEGLAGASGSDPSGAGGAITIAARGRSDGLNLECRQDGTANAVLTPSGGKGGLGVGAVAYRVDDPNAGRSAATVSAKWAKGSGGPAGDECQNLVAVPFVPVSPTLGAGGNKTGGDRFPGTSVDTIETLVAVPIADTAATLCKDSFSGGMGGRPDGAAQGHVVPVFAIQERAVAENPNTGPQGKGWQPDIAYTLEARHHVQAVAFAQNTRDEIRMFGGDGQIVGALAAEPGSKQQCYVVQQEREVAPTISARPGGGGGLGTDAELDGAVVAVPFIGDVSATVTSNGDAHSGFRNADGLFTTPAVNGWAVRKLTPRECERLQGFPDDFTAIRWRGKPASQCPDGPRYKAIGNSMAVNVMRWIGMRIDLVERAVAAGGGA